MIGLILLIFVIMGRSNKKRENETRQMLDNLMVGDEVTTTAGIIGQIVSIKDETVVIETSRERTKIRFLKTSIARVDVPAAESISAPKSVKKAAEKAKLKDAKAPEKLETATLETADFEAFPDVAETEVSEEEKD
jgi:preprotein translocase subunit YajC